MFKIAIDAGHGMNTAGKRTPDDEREWSFNNKVVLSFIKEMKKYENVQILRLDDESGKTDIPLKTRTDKANQFKADLLISVHHNALKGVYGNHTGTETFTYLGNHPKSEKLASIVQKNLLKAYGLKDRGLKKADFHMLRESEMDSILVEGCYMDSSIDIVKLRDDRVLKNVGVQLALSVVEFASLKKKVIIDIPKKPNLEKPSNTEEKKVLYKVQVGAFSNQKNCEGLKVQLEKLNYKPFIQKSGNLYKLQVGAFSQKSNGEQLIKELKTKGFTAFLVEVKQ